MERNEFVELADCLGQTIENQVVKASLIHDFLTHGDAEQVFMDRRNVEGLIVVLDDLIKAFDQFKEKLETFKGGEVTT